MRHCVTQGSAGHGEIIHKGLFLALLISIIGWMSLPYVAKLMAGEAALACQQVSKSRTWKGVQCQHL